MAGVRNYAFQRSYYFDSHDAQGNFNGLTEDAWKQMILQQWTCANLKANHVTVIFHSKDTDDHGNIKPLHAHACSNQQTSIPQTNMMKLTGCSCEENCEEINDKAQSYKYLLHITEQAIKERKHIYSEDELIIDVLPGQKYDFHAIIAGGKDKEEKDALKKIISDIENDEYGTGDPNDKVGIMTRLLIDNKVSHIMSTRPTNRRAIESAVEVHEEKFKANKRLKKNATKATTP